MFYRPTRIILCISLLAMTWTGDHEAIADSIAQAGDSARAVTALKTYLSGDYKKRGPLTGQLFAKTPLTKVHAAQAAQLLRTDHRKRIRTERAEEMKTRVLKSALWAIK